MKRGFVVSEIRRIRTMRRDKRSVPFIASAFYPAFTRDQVNEAVDAIMREPGDWDACDRVNRVMAMQNEGFLLINGNPVDARGPVFTGPRRTEITRWRLR